MSSADPTFLVTLIALSLATAAIFGEEHQALRSAKSRYEAEDKTETARTHSERSGRIGAFKTNFLVIYALVTASDWLQGPYLFSLYHDEYSLSLHVIAILFVLGFLSAGLSAPFVGKLADSWGRKKVCLLFCGTYIASCLTKLSPRLSILSGGRVLGGVATSMLFSVFESWLVSQSRSEAVRMSNEELSVLLGRAGLVQGLMAAFSGVASNVLVSLSGTFVSPFMASATLLVISGVIICGSWEENYGGGGETAESRSRSGWQAFRENPLLPIILAIITVFETSMYLFVFLWVPNLTGVQKDGEPALPLGLIFSSFMVSMMLGSAVYNRVLLATASTSSSTLDSGEVQSLPSSSLPATSSPLSTDTSSPTTPSFASPGTPAITPSPCQTTFNETSSLLRSAPESTMPTAVKLHFTLVALLMVVAAVSLGGADLANNLRVKFFCFALFELTVGMYYPTIGTLRALLIPPECRATMTALFRVPVNLLVTLALVTGMEARPSLVAGLSCAMLLSVSGVTAVALKRSSSHFL